MSQLYQNIEKIYLFLVRLITGASAFFSQGATPIRLYAQCTALSELSTALEGLANCPSILKL